MKKVEQVDVNNKVVKGLDLILSQKEIREILSRHFVLESEQNPYRCKLGKKAFVLCVKQITYLGNPHPIFKKRIQIPKNWKTHLAKGALLMGIYQYKNNRIFVIFDTAKYKNNQINNSSAHVHTIDLQKGMEYGIFEKTDSRKNKISVIREDCLKKYIQNTLLDIKNQTPKEIKLFADFSLQLEKEWSGEKCYEEMFEVKYRNKGQPEWPGFYLEFQFENHLKENPKLKKVCNFVSNKKHGELDFDLDFNGKYLGDLKTHSLNSNSIPGNDKRNFMKTIKLHNKFWYIVFSHDTKYDKNNGNKVTKHWNKLMNKKDLLSYANRMKYSIGLRSMKILEINKNNLQYISDMTQGKNSDGNERAIKIQITKKYVDNFLIFSQEL